MRVLSLPQIINGLQDKEDYMKTTRWHSLLGCHCVVREVFGSLVLVPGWLFVEDFPA